MANRRWIQNPILKQFSKISIPVTDSLDNNDYQITAKELSKVISVESPFWNLKAEVLPTCHSFSDPEYLKAGSWFFEDISNTEQKPDKLAGKKVQFARLLCETGRSETEGLNFVKQYLFYINMTDNELELTMRGVLLNGGGEVQGATPWQVGVDKADNLSVGAKIGEKDIATLDEGGYVEKAKDAQTLNNKAEGELNVNNALTANNLNANAKLDGREIAIVDNTLLNIPMQKILANTDWNTLKPGTYYSNRSDFSTFIHGPLTEDDYYVQVVAFVVDGKPSRAKQIAYPRNLHSYYVRNGNVESFDFGSWSEVATNDFVIKNNNKIIGRNLITLLGATSARDAFDKIRAMGTDYSKLQLGDYIDIPSITVGGTTLQNTSGNLRVEIQGFDHYYRVGDTESPHGILFGFRNCALTKRYNASDTTAGGYNGSELKKYVNNDFAKGLESAIGTIKTVHRLVDTHGSWSWTAEKCFLPTEVEVFGYQAWGRGGYYGGTSVQYPIYSLDPSRRIKTYNGSRQWWWEGTSQNDSTTHFCYGYHGNADSYNASGVGGVSPAFYI